MKQPPYRVAAMNHSLAPLATDLRPLLRRDGEWLRCAEPHCGDRAFWGAWRPSAFLRVKVAAHRAKMHAAGRPVGAGRPQRRVAAAQAALPAGLDADLLAALGEEAAELARTHCPQL